MGLVGRDSILSAILGAILELIGGNIACVVLFGIKIAVFGLVTNNSAINSLIWGNFTYHAQ